MNDVAAIILAAGMSRRMGERNKLLLPVKGIPMIRNVVENYRAVTTGPVLVVTGFEANEVTKALAGCDVQLTYNPDFEEGQQRSVACGLRAVENARQILIGLGDQPLLSVADLRTLLFAHASGDPRRISIPMLDGQRGNPIVVPHGLHRRLLENPQSPGCKTFTRENLQLVQFCPLDSSGFYTDVDTPAAYAALSDQSGEMLL